MQNIEITRYAKNEAGTWDGYVEPADHSWIVFVKEDGSVVAYLNRDPETGAVL